MKCRPQHGLSSSCFRWRALADSRHLKLLLKYVKINDQNHRCRDENVDVWRHEAATTPEQIQCTCVAQTVCSMEAVSRRNTLREWPSAGVFPLVFVSVTVHLRYNRLSMQTIII